MGSLSIVFQQELVKIELQRLQILIDLFSEGDLVELVQNRAVEPFTDTVGLWRLHLGFGVINVVNRQIELVIMRQAILQDHL